MGSGNQFVEVQGVAKIIDAVAAKSFGLSEGQVTVLIHSGSRGLGHQVCTDYVKRMDTAIARYKIVLPDRELACAPLSSPEGQAYMGAMACAANFAWANRQANRPPGARGGGERPWRLGRRGHAPGIRHRPQRAGQASEMLWAGST
jgi:RNA-splicing ligase RtcB